MARAGDSYSHGRRFESYRGYYMEGSGANYNQVPAKQWMAADGRYHDVLVEVIASADHVKIGPFGFNREDLLLAMGVNEHK
jgi:hypothetical protein